MKKLQDKWALVTGSSRGVGRQVALGLAGHGCNIIVHGRTPAHCSETLALLEDFGVEVRVAAGDLGSVEETRRLIDAVEAEQIAVDVLYNNAGVISGWQDSAFDIPMEEWERVFNINVFSMVQLCNAFVPPMVRRGWGRVVNVTSGIQGKPQRAPYGASKAAVDKYTRDLAVELAGSGVLVSAVDPGWLKTAIGGERAPNAVESVLPGALVPVLLDYESQNALFYSARDFSVRKPV